MIPGDDQDQGTHSHRVQFEASDDSIETRAISVSQDWLEAGTVSEVLEALHNWMATQFLVAPWDWSGILMARVIHKAGFFSMVCKSESEQRNIMEKFIDKVFAVNRRNCAQGDPPLVYKDIVEVATAVVSNHNGKHRVSRTSTGDRRPGTET